MNLMRSFKLTKLSLRIQKRNLSYIELGTGDPLLDPIILCHGLLGNKNNFTTIGKTLHKRTGRTVFSLDMVNHGGARISDHVSYQDMADEIDLAIDELADGSAVLIGHSMGGRAVMWEALQHQTKVSSLIVVDVAPGKGFARQDHVNAVESIIRKMNDIGLVSFISYTLYYIRLHKWSTIGT